MLLFAFILLSLSYWKQHCRYNYLYLTGCDLLSFYYLCRTGNNSDVAKVRTILVVICFHFTIFVVLETTSPRLSRLDERCDLLSFYYLCRTGNNAWILSRNRNGLWFAFILLSLSYWKQRHINSGDAFVGCDLLSFYYLCRTGNNIHNCNTISSCVVICFHFTIFVVLETTGNWRGIKCKSCDLLSFYYLCRTGNNNREDMC